MNILSFKSIQLKKSLVKRRLRNWITENGVDSSGWYTEANEFAQLMSTTYNVPLTTVCGIISALSPQKSWEENKKLTVRFLSNGTTHNQTQLNINKAKCILVTDNVDQILAILNGNKTKNFFLNILYPNKAMGVTIDRHAIAAALQTNKTAKSLDKSYAVLTDKQYDFFAGCYTELAGDLGILPHQLQAIVWVNYRSHRKINYKKFDVTNTILN
jgi:hypothetical protein